MATTVPTTNAVETLRERIIRQAELTSLPVASEAEAEVLHQKRLRAATRASATEPASYTIELPRIPHLDSHRPGVLVGNYAVLISQLGETVSEAEQWIHACEYHAAATLSWLPSKYREDLHIFFVAPLGASNMPGWIEIASRIERDERICRKLVWLPPKEQITESADAFLERTFFARPWRSLTNPSHPRLDPIEDVVRMLSSNKELSDTPQEVIRRWLDVLTHPSEVPDIVTPLVQALEELKK